MFSKAADIRRVAKSRKVPKCKVDRLPRPDINNDINGIYEQATDRGLELLGKLLQRGQDLRAFRH